MKSSNTVKSPWFKISTIGGVTKGEIEMRMIRDIDGQLFIPGCREPQDEPRQLTLTLSTNSIKNSPDTGRKG